MRYIVDTDRARKIYRTSDMSAKILVACASTLPFGAVLAFLCRPYVISSVACAVTLAASAVFLAALAAFLYTHNHVATRYIELIEHIKPKILGLHIRTPQGSNGFEGMQEVYFTFSGEDGKPEEFVLGTVTETKEHYLDAPMVDITNQKFYM